MYNDKLCYGYKNQDTNNETIDHKLKWNKTIDQNYVIFKKRVANPKNSIVHEQ